MVFDVTNKDLRLILRALLCYEQSNYKGTDKPYLKEEAEDTSRMKSTVIELLKEKRKRYQY